jgi:membrane protein YqaA with SNARE-associated domain
MKRIVAWASALALSLGGPGLFFIAFLDASFLSLPEINDILIVSMVTHDKARLVYYASMSTLGSVAGCLVLYWLAWKGGESILRRWFHERHIERGLATFQRYGLLALLVPSILPPPAPFKIFVLLGGVARVPLRKFVGAILLGRGLRYFGEGLLAVWYGDAALGYIRDHGKEVALWTGLLVLAGGVAYFWWQSRKGAVRPGV